MASPRKSWPRGADEQRREAIECAEETLRLNREAIALLRSASDLIVTKPSQADVKLNKALGMIAEALAEQERILRLLNEARQQPLE